MTRHTCNPFHATEAEVAACPGCQAGDTYDGWRAHAEALEEVLRELVDRYCVANRPVLPASYCLPHEELPTSHDPYCSAARAVLARLPAQALAERRTLEAKAAHAAALAAALEETLAFAEGLGGWDDVDFAAAKSVRAALAYLPAQALAERRALEACAEPLSVFIARHRSAEGAHLREECERWAKDFADCRACCAGEDTLAALDAARKPATDAHTPEWVGWDGIK